MEHPEIPVFLCQNTSSTNFSHHSLSISPDSPGLIFSVFVSTTGGSQDTNNPVFSHHSLSISPDSPELIFSALFQPLEGARTPTIQF